MDRQIIAEMIRAYSEADEEHEGGDQPHADVVRNQRPRQSDRQGEEANTRTMNSLGRWVSACTQTRARCRGLSWKATQFFSWGTLGSVLACMKAKASVD